MTSANNAARHESSIDGVSNLRSVAADTGRNFGPRLARTEPRPEARLDLRELATASASLAPIQLSLVRLWQELRQGECKVVDSFFTADRYFLLTRAVPEPSLRPNRQRQRILQAVLVGGAQKIVALELRVAPSTVASNAYQALEELGMKLPPSRTHPLVVLAAKAERMSDDTLQASSIVLNLGNRAIRVLSMPRPERHLSRRLPHSEFEVMQRLIEGECYREIARQRGTSERTVANQIASVFRKLRVSGRAELLLRLFEQPSEQPNALEKPRASH